MQATPHVSIDEQALQIAASIVARGEYATLDEASRAICASHRAHSLEQLGVSVAAVPALALLLHIEVSVGAYTAAFLATHGVATLRDLESEVVARLSSLATPPLARQTSNPEEIDIDEEADASAAGPSSAPGAAASFCRYRVGPLARHPAVRAHWPAGGSSEAYLGYAEMAQHLTAYLAQRSAKACLDVCPADFESFVAKATGRSLAQLGVVLVPAALPSTVASLRHAVSATRELEVTATKLALGQVSEAQRRMLEEMYQAGWASKREQQQQRARRRRRKRRKRAEAAGGRASASASSSSATSSGDDDDDEEEEEEEEEEVVAEEAVKEAATAAELEATADGDAAGPEAKRRRRRRADASSADAANPEPASSAPAPQQPQSSQPQPAAPQHPAAEAADDVAAASADGAAASAGGGGGTPLEVVRRPAAATPAVPSQLSRASGVGGAPSPSAAVSVGAQGGAYSVLPWHGTLAWSSSFERDDRKAVGRWGEALVYNYLLATSGPSRVVTWVNRLEESRAPYDLTLGTLGGGPLTFIEVKTTRYGAEHNVLDLSYAEWEYMRTSPVAYSIFRVSGAGEPAGARITIIDEPLRAVQEGSIRLCMAV